jgi:fatty acid desaturase
VTLDARLTNVRAGYQRVHGQFPDKEWITVIILGLILAILGLLLSVPVLWVIGLVLIVVGAVLWIAGAVGHEIGGRRHYY